MIAIHSAINISHSLSLLRMNDLSADSVNYFCVAPDLLCFEYCQFFLDQRSLQELKFEYVRDTSEFAGVLD